MSGEAPGTHAVLSRQQRALRFLSAPGDYAHPSWWPDAFLGAFGPACRPDAGARAGLSAWMLEQHGLAGSVDLDFDAPARRFWLLPAELIRQVALDLGAALHGPLMRLCVTRAQWQWLGARLDRGTVDYALSDDAARWASSLAGRNSGADAIPDAAGCADIGAALLLRAAEGCGAALARRARLFFPRHLSAAAPSESQSESAPDPMAGAVARSLQITPSWRWLYS